MRKVDLNELKAIQIAILEYVATFCEQNSIQYSLAYGTLLGAVRHKGYIPWDDDIDIMMKRDDYEKFIALFKNDSQYKVYTYSLDSSFPFSYAKIADIRTLNIEEMSIKYHIGINIDLFPIDGISSDKNTAIHHIASMQDLIRNRDIKLTQLRHADSWRGKGYVLFHKIRLIPMSIKKIIFQIIDLQKKYSIQDSAFLTDLSFPFENRIMSQSIFNNYTKGIFEGKEYSILEKYDDYLTKVYGNYLQLPPVEKQISHHKFKAYKY